MKTYALMLTNETLVVINGTEEYTAYITDTLIPGTLVGVGVGTTEDKALKNLDEILTYRKIMLGCKELQNRGLTRESALS